MHEVKVEKLTSSKFQAFGSYFSPEACGEPLGGGTGPVRFYPDKIVSEYKRSNAVAFSSLIIEPRELRITTAEMHQYTEEIFGGFTEDIVFYVAPEGDIKSSVNGIKVFYLPAGWWVSLKPGIWHHAPFLLGKGYTVGTVVLPPETYKNDCFVCDLDESVSIKP